LEAGYADIDITPEPGEEMTGYGYFLNRCAAGTLDPLLARAVALGDGEARAVIVQLDLLGLSKEFVAGVRAEAQRRFGLPPDHLLLHCTHTHSGPATMPVFGCGMPSEHFLIALRGQLVQVIGAALDALRPAAALYRFAGDFPEGFAYNRTGGSNLDTRIWGVQIEFADAQPIVVLSYACHPVTLGINREYSADYPGAVIREFTAYGTRALYLNGCCGDINPLCNTPRVLSRNPETLLIYGRDLAATARQAMEQRQEWQPGPLRACSQIVPLEAEVPDVEELRHSLQEHRAALRDNPADGELRVAVMWHEKMLRHHETGTLNEAMETEIQAIACGDVVFVGLSAETFTRLGQIIRQSAPDHHLIIAATSNGVLGYIGTREDVEGRGYASQVAAKIYGMLPSVPDGGEKWATEGSRIVAEVIGRS